MASLILGGIGNAILPGISGIASNLLGGVRISVLGGLFGRRHQDDPIRVTFGQHVQDVYLTGSSEGAPIRKLWGRLRISGNVIWCSKFNEWQETEVNWTPSASAGKGSEAAAQNGSLSSRLSIMPISLSPWRSAKAARAHFPRARLG